MSYDGPSLSEAERERLQLIGQGKAPVINDTTEAILRNLGLVDGDPYSPTITELGRSLLADRAPEPDLIDHCPVCLSAPNLHTDVCPLRTDDGQLLGIWAGGFTTGTALALRAQTGISQRAAQQLAGDMFLEFVKAHNLTDPDRRAHLAQTIRDAARLAKLEGSL